MVTMTPGQVAAAQARRAVRAASGCWCSSSRSTSSFPYDRAKEVAIRMAQQDVRRRRRDRLGRARRSAWRSCSTTSACAPARRRASRPASRSTRRRSRRRCWRCCSSSFSFSADAGRAGRQDRPRPDRGARQEGAVPHRASARATSTWRRSRACKETINLPLTGKLKLEVELASETGRYADANGAHDAHLRGLRAGDGKTPLKVAGNPVPGAAG